MIVGEEDHFERVRRLYEERSAHGPYGTLAPGSRGGGKSRYVAAVFDAALLARLTTMNAEQAVLDLGCGTGIFTVQVARTAGFAVGADLSFHMVAAARGLAAREHRPPAFVMTEGLRLPFAPASFDAVIARETLCHVPDAGLPTVLDEVRRILTPGGGFYLLDQVSESPRWRSLPAAPLTTRRSVDELIQASARAGLVLTDGTTVRQPRFPWIYAIQVGLVPNRCLGTLARWEAAWNRRFAPVRTRRWQDVLLVFAKPPRPHAP